MIVMRPAVGVRVRADELAFAPGGTALVAPAPGYGVMIWRAFASGAKAELIELPGSGASRAAFAPDGTLFAGNDALYAVRPDARRPERVPTDQWHTLGFGVSPDGTRLVVSEFQRNGETTRLTCRPADDFTEPLWQIEVRAHVYLSPVFAPDGATFIQIESIRDPATRHWRSHRVRRSLTTGAAVETSKSLMDHTERFALSPDGRLLAVVIREDVYIYPAAGPWEVIQAVPNEGKKHFTGVAFHPSGQYLAATSNDKTVRLIDTATWELARTFTWDIGRMRSIAFSQDGTLAAAGSDTGKVVVWDVDV